MAEQLFPKRDLPPALVQDLQLQNPWWSGGAMKPLPPFKRWPFNKLLQRLNEPLAPVVVIRGPRQIGKTTLQLQVIEKLLNDGVSPNRILRVQFDELKALSETVLGADPILRIVEWFASVVLKGDLNLVARENRPAYLFLDEVQNLASWDVQLKSLVDHVAVRVLVTGSSALRIEQGRDSLAGRVQTIEVGPLRMREIAAIRHLGDLIPAQVENGWTDWLKPDFWREVRQSGIRQSSLRDVAFQAFSERGGYPVAHQNVHVPWSELADQLSETIVRRVIQHDLRIGERGRKRDQQLLEEVFRMACRYVGQAPNPATLAGEAQRALSANVGAQRIRHYIEFLDSSLLIRAIEPLEIRLKKRKGYAKLVLCDHAIRAAWLQEVIPLDSSTLDQDPRLSDLAGRIAESTAGYFFKSLTGLDVAHLPERAPDPEVDFVLTIGAQRIPVEVKYRRMIDGLRDTIGLRAFIEKAVNNAPLGLLVTRDDETQVPDPRVVCVPLKSLLLVR